MFQESACALYKDVIHRMNLPFSLKASLSSKVSSGARQAVCATVVLATNYKVDVVFEFSLGNACYSTCLFAVLCSELGCGVTPY